MKIGFAGAGKVGFTLGKYFQSAGIEIAGYFSKSTESASKAAEFTHSACYDDINILTKECDALFLTVPDKCIGEVYSSLSKQAIKGKLICHCSGVTTAWEAFPDAESHGALICSVHPLFAISHKKKSYGEIAGGFFTLEGSEKGVKLMSFILDKCKNPYQVIKSEDKVRYHMAASMASNLVVGLVDMSIENLVGCGFTRENALKALAPLVTKNIDHIFQCDVEKSLTGPVERCDEETVKKHLSVLDSKDDFLVYKVLSKRILEIAKSKNKEKDYKTLENILKGKEYEEEHRGNLCPNEEE
ncbi:MAG: Rossmann-like and DUF2520 domain-containing protein [Ruminococcus sp.]